MNRALFQAPQSSFDPNFWEKLYDIKLNVLKLNSSEQVISAEIGCSAGKRNKAIDFNIHSHSSRDKLSKGCVAHGSLFNVNTVEEFKDCDKRAVLRKASINLLSDIISGTAIENPDKLLTFLLLTYSDLKAYRFTYWMGVPAIVPDQPFHNSTQRSLCDVLTENGSNLSTELYRVLMRRLLESQEDPAEGIEPLRSTFAIKITTTNETMQQSATGPDLSEYQMQGVQHTELLTLSEAWDDRYSPDVFIVVVDSSAAESGFGWGVRNLLAMMAFHHSDSSSNGTVRLIGLRGSVAKRLVGSLNNLSTSSHGHAGSAHLLNLSEDVIVSSDESVYSEFSVSAGMIEGLAQQACAALGFNHISQARLEIEPATGSSVLLQEKLLHALEANRLEALTVVGWETNERGKPGPRVADLSQALDSRYLMAQAVDLNLRLMKWRLWPTLDTEKLASTKCLLLGAGTLGCAVARALLGWGVRDITLVDNGRVSYSNPARQCLFEFEDCENRAFKATAAAQRLRKIFPGVRSEGVVLSIPMPGHPMHLNSAEMVQDERGETISEDESQFRRLDELVRNHDVVFALTDSREARWLPTTMCATYGKLLINSALGFDTYLVMRHGQQVDEEASPVAVTGEIASAGVTGSTENTTLTGTDAPKLGCYFCNDIVAATNSQKDRTLDQQCTVTRPGLSFIAAALAVELMVALLHEEVKEKGRGKEISASDAEREGDKDASPEIPHQIRGSVSGFTQFTPHTPAFSCCTACSPPIVNSFRDRGFGFVRDVCIDSSLLERTSGVTQLMEAVDVDDTCFDSEDDF